MDNLYFKDKNEGKKEIILDSYTDCNGKEFCVVREEDLPYIQEQEILAPVFISTTMGSETYYKGKVMKELYFIKKRYALAVNRPFRVGDIFIVDNRPLPRFYFKKKFKKDIYNNFVFEIARMDGEQITSVEAEKFRKGKSIKVKGHLVEKKINRANELFNR